MAYDYSGQAYYCSQTITVAGGGGYADIHWPPDYTVHDCNPQTDPEFLPPPYDHPVINSGGDCSQLLTSYDDKVFNINPPACRKIVRTWTVVDWCQYDPNAYHPVGIWEYVQIIKIAPSAPPTIWCPSDTIISAGADCSGGHVTLPPAYGSSDCGAGVIITNNSPYAFSHGADASGNYPPGTTKVTFWADDGCGQKTSCSMYITVKDLKKPTPVCFYGISFPLMQMPNDYALDLQPWFFNKGSFDNCTPPGKLKMWVEPSRVDCDDVGPVPVKFFVEDESGNVEYCNTLVYVQDNLGICPPNDGIIDGVIYNATGEILKDVKVSLQQSQEFAMTDSEGLYAFPALRFGNTYTISPSYPDDNLAGISALDMGILLKHILGIERFNSPFQFIAADLDRSGRVAVNDLLAIKELILMDYYGQSPLTTWRFVDATYQFQSVDPLSEPFPETYHIPLFTENMSSLDFVGVKLGDINSDAPSHLRGTVDIMSRTSMVAMQIPDQSFNKGETIEANVYLSSYESIQAMQFALEVDPDLVEVVGIEVLHKGQGLDVYNRSKDLNLITALWYGVEQLSQPRLFSVKFHALRNGTLSEAVKLPTSVSSLAFSDESSAPRGMRLEFTTGEMNPAGITDASVAGLRVSQNYPNPFYDETHIPIVLTRAGLMSIEVFDINGRLLMETALDGVEGLQEIVIQASEIKAKGVVVCRITCGGATESVRMVLQPGS